MSKKKSLKKVVKRRRSPRAALRTRIPSERLLAKTERSSSSRVWILFTIVAVLMISRDQNDQVE